MRKQTKIAALVSAAALLAIGASMTSFAAWDNSTGVWIYTDRDGDPAEGWHRWNTGGEYYYADEDGVLVYNSLIGANGTDDLSYPIYYVGNEAARLSEVWVETENVDDVSFMVEGTDYVPDYLYHYIKSNKKAAQVNPTADPTPEYVLEKDIWTTTAHDKGKGRFIFDEDGYMVLGNVTIDDKDYYCVTLDDIYDNVIEVEGGMIADKYVEGQVLEGWAKFPGVGIEGEDEWRYYKDGAQVKDGAYSLKWEGQTKTYYFDETGALSTDDYVATATMSNAGSQAFTTINVDGNILTTPGWYQDPETEDWYYIVNVRDENRKLVQGVVFNAGSTVKRAKNIGGKVYVFDGDGVMLDESVTIEEGDCDGTAWNGIPCTTLTEGKTYYFNNVKNSGHRGEMQTGKITFTTKNDEEVTRYYDPDEGMMTNAIINGYVYDGNGNLYKALDSKYELYDADEIHYVYTIKSKKVVKDSEKYADGITGKFIVNGSGKAFENKTSVTVGYTDYTVKDYQVQ